VRNLTKRAGEDCMGFLFDPESLDFIRTISLIPEYLLLIRS